MVLPRRRLFWRIRVRRVSPSNWRFTLFKSIFAIFFTNLIEPSRVRGFPSYTPAFWGVPSKEKQSYIDGSGGWKGQWKFRRTVKWLGLRNKLARIASTRNVYDRLTNYVYTDTPSSRFWHKNVVGRVCVTIRVNRDGDSVLLEQIKKGPRWWLVYLPRAQIVIAGLCDGGPCELRTFSKARHR